MENQMNVVISNGGEFTLLGEAADRYDVIRLLKDAGYHLNQSDANGQGYNLSGYIEERLKGNIAGVGKMLTRNPGNPALFLFDNDVTDFESERKSLTERLDKEIAEAKAKQNEQIQARISEMEKSAKGWYIVELPLCVMDHKSGGHKERWTNWKVLAESEMDAYNQAVKKAEKDLNAFWFAEPHKCQIDFHGVWTDMSDEIIEENGLV